MNANVQPLGEATFQSLGEKTFQGNSFGGISSSGRNAASPEAFPQTEKSKSREAFRAQSDETPLLPEELPTVSIVIPVYNVERYVGRCVDSVIAQTYPKIECVIVDDCGNDASMDVVRGRLADYRGNVAFRILCHERNRGLSAARNTGTDAASGEYVWYVDSDDFISDDAVADIFGRLGADRPDIISFNYARFPNGDDFSARLVLVPAYESARGILDAICVSRHENWGAQFRIFRKAFLLRENLRFAEGLIHEDVEFLVAVLRTGTRAVRTDTHCVYYYRTSRAGSIMASGFPEKRMASLFELAEKSLAFAQARDENFQIYVEVFREMLFSILSGCASRKTEKRREFLLRLRSRKKEFGAMLAHASGRVSRLISRILPHSVRLALLAWRVQRSFPVACLRFAAKKIRNRFSHR